MPQFEASRKKVQRAEKHVRDLNDALIDFANSDFYRLAVEDNPRYGSQELVIDIDSSPEILIRCALIIGDALHNLRSALDILWWSITVNQTKHTHFPIRRTREDLYPP